MHPPHASDDSFPVAPAFLTYVLGWVDLDVRVVREESALNGLSSVRHEPLFWDCINPNCSLDDPSKAVVEEVPGAGKVIRIGVFVQRTDEPPALRTIFSDISCC